MLLTVRNLPFEVRPNDVKMLLKVNCNIDDLIFGKLMKDDNNTKKLTIGVADEMQAAVVTNQLNGLFCGGNRIYVEDYKSQKQVGIQQTNPGYGNFQPAPFQPNMMPYQTPQPLMNLGMNQDMMMQQQFMPFNNPVGGIPGGMPFAGNQNAFMGYGNQPQGENNQQYSQFGYALPTPSTAHGNEPVRDGRDSSRDVPFQDTSRGDRKRKHSPERNSHFNDRQRSRYDNHRDKPNRGDSRHGEIYDPEDSFRNFSSDTSRKESMYNQPEPWKSSGRANSRNRDEVPLYGSHVTAPARSGFNAERGNVWESTSQDHKGQSNRWEAPSRYEPPSRESKERNRFEAPSRYEPPSRNSKERNNRFEAPFRGTEPPRDHGARSQNTNSREFNVRAQEQKQNKPAPHHEQVKANKDLAHQLVREHLHIRLGKKPFKNGFTELMEAIDSLIREAISLKMPNPTHSKNKMTSQEIIELFRRSYTDEENGRLVQKCFKVSQASSAPQKQGAPQKPGPSQKMGPPQKPGAYKKPGALQKAVAPPSGGQTKTPSYSMQKGPVAYNKNAPQKQTGKKPEKKALTLADLLNSSQKQRNTKSKAGNKPLPKYFNDSKKENSQLKQLLKKEFLQDDLYKCEPVLEKAMNDELDALCSAFMSGCDNPANDDEKLITERISEVVTEDFRKAVRLHVVKRLLDIRSNLTVRVFAHGSPPHLNTVADVLKHYGVININKTTSGKLMFVGTCDSYESFDRLCAMPGIDVMGKGGPATLTAKPMHLAIPLKYRRLAKKSAEKMPKKITGNNDDACEQDDEDDDDDDVAHDQDGVDEYEEADNDDFNENDANISDDKSATVNPQHDANESADDVVLVTNDDDKNDVIAIDDVKDEEELDGAEAQEDVDIDELKEEDLEEFEFLKRY